MQHQDEDPLPELIARARAGDREAWGQIYLRFGEQLRKKVRQVLGKGLRRHQDSTDIVNSVLKDLPKHLHLYRRHDSPEGFVNWSTKIAVRKVFEKQKHENALKGGGAHRVVHGEEGAHLAESQPSPDESPDQLAAEQEEKALLARALMFLDPKDREPLRLSFSGLSNAEIAERLDCTQDAARMRVKRGEFRLEQQIRKLRKQRP